FRRIGLLYLAVMLLLMGGRAAVTQEPDVIDVLAWLATAVGVTVTCAVDSRIVGKPMLPITQIIMFFTWLFAAPIYLIWSRGRRGIIHALVAIIAFVTLLAIGATVTMLALHMIEDVRVNGW